MARTNYVDSNGWYYSPVKRDLVHISIENVDLDKVQSPTPLCRYSRMYNIDHYDLSFNLLLKICAGCPKFMLDKGAKRSVAYHETPTVHKLLGSTDYRKLGFDVFPGSRQFETLEESMLRADFFAYHFGIDDWESDYVDAKVDRDSLASYVFRD